MTTAIITPAANFPANLSKEEIIAGLQAMQNAAWSLFGTFQLGSAEWKELYKVKQSLFDAIWDGGRMPTDFPIPALDAWARRQGSKDFGEELAKRA